MDGFSAALGTAAVTLWDDLWQAEQLNAQEPRAGRAAPARAVGLAAGAALWDRIVLAWSLFHGGAAKASSGAWLAQWAGTVRAVSRGSSTFPGSARAHEALLCIQTQTTLNDPQRMRFQTDELYFKDPKRSCDWFFRNNLAKVKSFFFFNFLINEKVSVENRG